MIVISELVHHEHELFGGFDKCAFSKNYLLKVTHSTKNAPLPDTKSPGRTPKTGAISTFTGSLFMKPKQLDFI